MAIESISPGQFHAAKGVEDWRVVAGAAWARFETGSFGVGLALLNDIATLAEAQGHHPDLDLAYSHLTVRVWTHAVQGLSTADIALARGVSDLAARLGVHSAPSDLKAVEVAIDALVVGDVLPFWRVLLGYERVGDAELADPLRRNPGIWFQQMDSPRPQRNRIHLDVVVPHDQAEACVAAALAAGGRLVSDAAAPAWWVLADAEGNEACVCTWLERTAQDRP